MNESRIAATDRLRREGRYEEAAAFRDEKRRELKKAGASRQDAIDQSWIAMQERFPPLEVAPVVDRVDAAGAGLADAVRARGTDENPDPIDDVAWVYQHLGDEGLTADDFPNLGALSLWQWAQANPAAFYERLWPKAEEAGADNEPDLELEEIEAKLMHTREWLERRLCEDPRDAIRDATSNVLCFSIGPRFGTPVPSELGAGLLSSLVFDVALAHIGAASHSSEAPKGETESGRKLEVSAVTVKVLADL